MVKQNPYEGLCSLLLAARRRAKLTQMEVANQLAKPQSFVSKYESGERRIDVIEFVEICVVLRTDPADIIKIIGSLHEGKR